ncbi:hypothetical protein BT67DRAFT_156007 [Trichocladium antarcticum]|uniref:Uncharacterized protein n=1 Tax=Trichocladium antarcticum TaxID=1450529 RepID=A0AAN6ZB86_9PEZI|nr:hypothetical protein BT67DRAFT_156007 [Trichocladium antarcticum]
MKFSVAAVLAFAAMAYAYPTVGNNTPAKRQNTADDVEVQAAAMSDASGNVVVFESNKVNKDATAKGI